MAVRKLDHVNIRTERLEETIRFYADVIGLTAGASPGGAGSAWMTDDRGDPIIHLGRPRDDMPGGAGHGGQGSGAVHHVALECDDHDVFAERLTRLGLEFRRNEVAGMNLRQLFVRDPNGVLIELNFR